MGIQLLGTPTAAALLLTLAAVPAPAQSNDAQDASGYRCTARQPYACGTYIPENRISDEGPTGFYTRKDRYIDLSGANSLVQLRWKSWTKRRAVGRGTYQDYYGSVGRVPLRFYRARRGFEGRYYTRARLDFGRRGTCRMKYAGDRWRTLGRGGPNNSCIKSPPDGF